LGHETVYNCLSVVIRESSGGGSHPEARSSFTEKKKTTDILKKGRCEDNIVEATENCENEGREGEKHGLKELAKRKVALLSVGGTSFFGAWWRLLRWTWEDESGLKVSSTRNIKGFSEGLGVYVAGKLVAGGLVVGGTGLKKGLEQNFALSGREELTLLRSSDRKGSSIKREVRPKS